MDDKFLKPYDAEAAEAKIYKLWDESGLFNPDVCIEKGFTDAGAEPFSIVLPPPNVTGTLHMGSSLMLAIEDTVVRFERMRGRKTLWIPGMDHAAIATQSKVEKLLEKEGVRKADLGREKFLKRVNEFADENKATMMTQLKALGSSLDWTREAYTLDEKRELAVRTAFKKMYDEDLIYRGHRIVNWDPKGQTTISDDEIVYEERKGKIYTFKYSKDFPILIATTRPETKVGDVAVAVNPTDKRYKKYVGKTYEIADFCGAKLSIKIVADDSVDSEYGTGAVGVTPAHSMVDAEIAKRHALPTIQVINEYAKMMVDAPALKDKKVGEAREIIVEWLRAEKLLEKEEDVVQNLSLAERTGGVIEPLPKLQWFIDVNKAIPSRNDKSLKQLMREAVEKDGIKILPDRFEKVYYHWIENLRDWCISRQIWFGHRIPVWYKNEEIYVGIEAPDGEGWQQDEDTLDTWFSSGLWTFSTLGWPEKTKDLAEFHPTSLLETGYDILFFWVARMILMSKYLLDEVPFKTVYLHGLVRDSKGQKISKSLGNNVEPLEMIAKYGADAVRMSLIVGTGPGNDSKMSEEKLKAYKHFANKLWNIARFVLSQKDAEQEYKNTEKDKEYLSELNDIKTDITNELKSYKIHLAADKIYHYIWHKFADFIIEEHKQKLVSSSTLGIILETSLKLLHPFMPFITEEIWGSMGKDSLLMVEKWPSVGDNRVNE